MTRLAILGSASGGGAAQIIEALQGQTGLRPVFILDNEFQSAGKEIFGVPVIGKSDEIKDRWERKECDAVVIAVGGNLEERKRIFGELMSDGIVFANVIDPSVKLGLNTTIGTGNVILNNSYFGNNTVIGDNNYILNQCSVQHDTVIGSHNYFATNVTIGAKVKIGEMNRFHIKSTAETRTIITDSNIFHSGTVLKFAG